MREFWAREDFLALCKEGSVSTQKNTTIVLLPTGEKFIFQRIENIDVCIAYTKGGRKGSWH